MTTSALALVEEGVNSKAGGRRTHISLKTAATSRSGCLSLSKTLLLAARKSSRSTFRKYALNAMGRA